ncbi:unnamed protein product [Ilex paraguariensis]|uniref:C-CAP/cofactor C-like domain-containing protein n=1 Tax=Ilex paraguariensis TaxID=185542 RepID=A0ABC8QQB2_9AQUA
MEEGEAISSLNNITPSTTPKTLDPIAQSKHAALLERLSKKSHTRQSNPDNSPSSLSNPPFESTQSFLSLFSQSKLSIESHLSRIHQTPHPHSNPQLKSDLQNVSMSISDLEKLVAEKSYFLPSYEVRSCLKTVSDLKQTLDNVTSDVVPKKKFGFKNKSTKKDISLSNAVEKTQIGNPIVESENTGSRVWDSPGFKVKENEVLVKQFEVGSEEVGEFTLSDLRGCEVRLMGCLRALFVNKLRDCRVYVGPVLGSVLIEEVEGCVFVLASHQIRIHHARGCDFYLRVRSRPIIEDSSGVRFAPYCLRYDGIERDLGEANIGEETGNWANVDDFRWLRAVQSPNWSVLPDCERVGTVAIQSLES